MEVIKDNHNSMEVNCRNCQSKLRLAIKDIQGGDICQFFFNCIVCEKTNVIPQTSIPLHILGQL